MLCRGGRTNYKRHPVSLSFSNLRVQHFCCFFWNSVVVVVTAQEEEVTVKWEEGPLLLLRDFCNTMSNLSIVCVCAGFLDVASFSQTFNDHRTFSPRMGLNSIEPGVWVGERVNF